MFQQNAKYSKNDGNQSLFLVYNVEKVRKQKAEKRGGFQERIFLVMTMKS
nr:hypothetical protein [Bacillus pseudomycoides]